MIRHDNIKLVHNFGVEVDTMLKKRESDKQIKKKKSGAMSGLHHKERKKKKERCIGDNSFLFRHEHIGKKKRENKQTNKQTATTL